MKFIKFTGRAEFDYGLGLVVHEAGDLVGTHEGGDAVTVDDESGRPTLRTDKAQRWVTRGVAVHVTDEEVVAALDAAAGKTNEGSHSKPSEGLTIAQLKDALTAKDIPFADNAKKAELAALLDAAPTK